MQITVTIADKSIKAGIEDILNNEVYQYFDTTTLKLAKLPKIGAVVNAIFADAKFQKDLEKRILKYVSLEDDMWDAVGDVQLPGMDNLYKRCREVENTREAEIEAAQEAEQVERMVKALARAGYTVTKK